MDSTASVNLEAESKKRAQKVLAGCIIIVGIELGTLCVLSNYIGALCEQTGAELTQVALMFSVFNLTSAFVGLVVSALVDRVPMKTIMLVGAVCYIVFFAFLYAGSSLVMLYVGALFFGASNVCTGFAVAQSLITWWHARNVGKKISILSVAMSLFAMALSPIIANLLTVVGFKTTVLLNGGVLGVVMLLCVVFLISNKPSTYGLVPYESERLPEGAGQAYEPSGLTLKQAARTFSFWAILIAPALLMVPANGFVSNEAVVFESYGFDAVTSGSMISLYNGFCIVWVFLYGTISDRIGPVKTNIIYTSASIAVLVLGTIIGGFAGGVAMAVLFGIVAAYGGVLGAVTLGHLFGTRAIATLIALCNVVMGIGSMIGPLVASFIIQVSGSISLFMMLSAVICVVVLVLFVIATSKRAMARIKTVEAQGQE